VSNQTKLILLSVHNVLYSMASYSNELTLYVCNIYNTDFLIDKLDLLTHWLATDSLTCSVSLGELIESHARNINPSQQRSCYSLAQTVYTRCEAYRKAAVCMCRYGRYYGMLRYAQEVANFNEEDYLFVLETEPNSELALHLVYSSPPLLSVKRVRLYLNC
jgi:hypothetical protein